MKKHKPAFLNEDNIIFYDKCFRYIDHKNKLLTTGFKTQEALISNTDMIRFDDGTVKLMQERYHKFLGE